MDEQQSKALDKKTKGLTVTIDTNAINIGTPGECIEFIKMKQVEVDNKKK